MNTKETTKTTFTKPEKPSLNHSVLYWTKKLIVMILFCLVINHLSTPESFVNSENYRFPIEGFLSSIALCVFISIIAELNFVYYKKRHFSKKVEISTIVGFMASTLGYITLMYIPLSIILNTAVGGSTEIYYLVVGLLITLLISFTLIGSLYAQEIYDQYKLSLKNAELTIESGAKVKKLTYENISCFYIANKVVYTVQNDGKTINTDFTLNELEEKINDQVFYRANRQIIIHKEAVDQIEKIENGKLRIRLKDIIESSGFPEIIISRYKRKEFIDWYK